MFGKDFLGTGKPPEDPEAVRRLLGGYTNGVGRVGSVAPVK